MPQANATSRRTELFSPRAAENAVAPESSTSAHPVAASVTKRLFDIAVASLTLVLTLPVIVMAIVVVRITTPGPAVFRQQRIGLNGELFTIYKLRSMWVDNDDSEHRQHAISLIVDPGMSATGNGTYKLSDARVTGFGRFIRATSVDELPQLLNVIKGDMSLVGPRPMLDFEFEVVSGRHRDREQARPGMTGKWQVSGRSDLSTAEMLDLDVAYLDTWSFAGDLSILARTPFSLLSR